jgi:hypothetical protein
LSLLRFLFGCSHHSIVGFFPSNTRVHEVFFFFEIKLVPKSQVSAAPSMSSLFRGPLTSLPPKCRPDRFGSAPLLSPSPLEYPYRQFLSSSDYTEESIRSCLEAEEAEEAESAESERPGRCAYCIKVSVIALFFVGRGMFDVLVGVCRWERLC